MKRKKKATPYMLLVADRIKMFREDCERDEYTDTGNAWVLLDEAEKALRGGKS